MVIIDHVLHVPARSVLADDLWEMYRQTFDEINRLAAQRHMMYADEFAVMLEDWRIDKYLTRSEETGEVLSFGVQTCDLDAWHLISPQYFEHHWPQLYADQRIWYVGFVGVAPGAQGAPLFGELITRMARPVVDAGGLGVMDFCTYNSATRKLPHASRALLKRTYPQARISLLDAQEFWGFDFS